MPHFMIILIPYNNLLNLSWIKMSIFEEYGAFNILLRLRILYNSKFILVATSLGVNNIVITRIHCIKMDKRNS